MLPVVQESRCKSFTGLLQLLFNKAPGPGVLAVCLCMFGPTEDYYAAGLEKGKTLFVNAIVSDKSGAVTGKSYSSTIRTVIIDRAIF